MNTFNIRVTKANRELVVDWAKVPPAAQEFIIRYGLSQKFNDPYGDKAKFPVGEPATIAAVTKASDEMLARLYSGEIVTKTRASSAGLSALDRECVGVLLSLAPVRPHLKTVKEALKQQGWEAVATGLFKAKAPAAIERIKAEAQRRLDLAGFTLELDEDGTETAEDPGF